MVENYNKLKQSITNLEKSISKLEKRVAKQTSFKRNFTMSLVRGFGGAIGATVIFGLALALIIQIVRSIDYVPIINNILSSQAIESVIDRFTKF